MFDLGYKKLLSLFAILVLSVSLQGCLDENTSEEDDPSVSVTETYTVKYASDMSMIMAGKSTFTLNITNRDSGAAVSGLNVSVMPMMAMAAGHSHSAPVGDVIDNGDGSYTATVFYLMPSSMMDGTVMGEWTLNVNIGGMGGETASFTPEVMMAMGDTLLAKLKGQADVITIMGTTDTENRTYFLFKNSLTGMTDNHNFSLFLATKESMMSFPAVYAGTTLNQGHMTDELIVTTVSVKVSTDKNNWVDAIDNGNGYWDASAISGLTNDVSGKIYVHLVVESEQKTTNGLAIDGANDYAEFTVTPGMSMSM